MTNSEILHFIIERLKQSPISWKGDKELFELLFSPIAYGNELENKRKVAKQYILDIFKDSKFNKTKFNKLANNIICGENEKKHKKEVLYFLQDELKRLNIVTDIDLMKLIDNIPCKDNNENNYRSRFSYWKKNSTAIHNKDIKHALEKNFDFQNKLWERGDLFIKEVLTECTDKFIKKHMQKKIDLFSKIRDEFNLKDDLTKDGLNDLKMIQKMNQNEIKKYIHDKKPLSNTRSQKFILELIAILHSKGYYNLLLQDALEALDLHHRENIEIKKIQAHALGSSEVGEYKKAFDLLSTISTDNDSEIIDMQTEAISNMRRYQLNDKKLDNNQKQEIITKLIAHYEEIFKHNNSYHYYPGINLAYIIALSANLSPKNSAQHETQIDQIYKKAKKSIEIDKKSKETIKRYYANITTIEFMLLRNMGNIIAEFERFLELEEENISSIELERTQRQMQFFIDTSISFGINENQIISNMQKTVELIDNFIDYQMQTRT